MQLRATKLGLLLTLMSMANTGIAKTCCDTESARFLDMDNDECLAAGHVPYDPSNPMSAASTMVCFQSVNKAAQGMLGELGLPNNESIDVSNPPRSVDDLMLAGSREAYQCCNSRSALFEGAMAVEECRSTSSYHYPDIPEFLNETEVCRGGSQGGGGAWQEEDYEPNIENGGMESWKDDHRPTGFASFGMPSGLSAGLSSGQPMDIQVSFRDRDSHTGQYSLRLKNYDITENLPPQVRGITKSAVGSVVSPAGAHTCREPCASETASNSTSNSLSGAFSQIASLSARDVKSHVCGAYKGFIASSDQLRIDLVLESSSQVNGGAQAIFTESTSDWVEFLMPMSTTVGQLPERGAVGITARVEPRVENASPYAQAMASMKQTKMSPLTEVKVDSIHFCDPMGIQLFHPPVLVNGDPNILIPEAEEDNQGAQTFVNRDNDDADGAFDSDDTEVFGEDELVRLKLYLPLNSFGEVRFSAPGLASGKYALWDDPNKSSRFVDANKTLEVLSLLRTTPDGSRYEREIWVEALEPSTAWGDMRFEFTFESEFDNKQAADAVVITALDFESISFEGQDNSASDTAELDSEPNVPSVGRTSNLRVFPGKRWDSSKKAPEDQARNRVDVIATLNLRPVRPIKAFFRSFDADDPSADDDEVDDETTAQDNRGAPELRAGFFPKGTDGQRQEIEFEDREVRFEFQVSMQPGDNFILAGSFDKDHLDALENDDTILSQVSSSHGVKVIDENVWRESESVGRAALPQNTLSDLLTVWRKLYLEIDTMRPVRDNELEGFITGVASVSSDREGWRQYEVDIDRNIYESLPDDAKTGLEGLENTYKRGTMTINNVKFRVDYSTANRFTDDTITLTFGEGRASDLETAVGANPIGLPFTLVDNDKHLNGDELGSIPLDRMLASYAPAYVLPVLEAISHNPISRVPFLLNYQDDEPEYLRSIYEFDNKAYHEDSDFWLVYLLTAFQGTIEEDGDGGYQSLMGFGEFVWENAISGQADSSPGGIGGQGAAIFVESGMELENGNKGASGWRLSDTAPHEIGHLFGGSHRDGGLMDDRREFKSENFSPTSLDKIRSHLYP